MFEAFKVCAWPAIFITLASLGLLWLSVLTLVGALARARDTRALAVVTLLGICVPPLGGVAADAYQNAVWCDPIAALKDYPDNPGQGKRVAALCRIDAARCRDFGNGAALPVAAGAIAAAAAAFGLRRRA